MRLLRFPGVSPVLVGRDEEAARLDAALGRAASTVFVGGAAGVGKTRLVAEFVETADATVLSGEGGVAPFSLFSWLPVVPDGPDARPRLFEAALARLARLAADKPVVLVAENLDRADRSSLDLLEFLVRHQASAPGSLIVATYRPPAPSMVPDLVRLPWAERVELAPLGESEVGELMRRILGVAPDPGQAHEVFQRTEGNPLSVEVALGSGAGLDRLPPDSRYVAGIVGTSLSLVTPALLAAVAELDERALAEAVRVALDEHVLHFDGEHYFFRHELIAEAARPGAEESRRLHARFARALRDTDGHHAYIAGNHLFMAGDHAGAARVAWAAEGVAFPEQLALLERVLEARVALTGLERVALLERAAEAAVQSGEDTRAEQFATLALSIVDREREPARAAVLLDHRACTRARLGQPGALADHREAIRLMPDENSALARLFNSYALRLLEIPQKEAARAAAEEALRAAGRHSDGPAEATALITLAELDSGDLDAQLPHLKRARAIAESLAEPRLRLRALHVESSLMRAYGRLAAAEDLARQGLAVAEAAGLTRSVSAVHSVDLASAQLDSGRWAEAIATVDQAVDRVPEPGYRGHLLCLKGFVALYRGETELPDRLVGRAHEQFGEQVRLPQDPLLVARLETELRILQGRFTDARVEVERALDDPGATAGSLWPLLTAAARLATDERCSRGPDLLARLRSAADRLPVTGPVQAAFAAQFAAQASGEAEHWLAAVAAWTDLEHPLRLAQAQFGAGEATLRADDREAAAAALRSAYELAGELNAAPLRDRVADLARRSRVMLVRGLSGYNGRISPEQLGLTRRELDILRLLSAGRTNQEIGEELFIAAKTAGAHVSNILNKLGAASRGEAAATAHRLGLFT